jgi:hypothetical protein
VNDECPGAEALRFAASGADEVATVEAETWFATNSAGGTCESSGGPDRVYSFTTSLDRKMVATVARHANSPGYMPVVYRRTLCDSASDLMELTCGKQSWGVATATVNTLPAGTHFLWVDGKQTAATDTPGLFTLEVTLSAPVVGPPNESCPGATPIQLVGGLGTTTTIQGTTVGGQNEATGSCSSSSGADVVYSFTLTTHAQVAVKLTPATGYSPMVFIRSACGSYTSQQACAYKSTATAATATVKNLRPGT